MLQKLSLPRKLHMTAESNGLKSYCFFKSMRVATNSPSPHREFG